MIIDSLLPRRLAFALGTLALVTFRTAAFADFTLADSAPTNLGSFGITIVPNGSLSANSAALAAFQRAALQWQNRIADPITITIDAQLAPLGSNIIGQANSVILSGGYTLIRNQMVLDSANEADDAVVAFLPAALTADLRPGYTLGSSLLFTKANAKALGFSGLDTTFGASDGTITFSSDFAFDFDNSDGVGEGLLDFETVAAHEIGHTLGFVSSVDDFDQGAPGQYNAFTLDLFRFASSGAGKNPVSDADFASFPRNLVPGDNAITDDLTNEWRMSTGANPAGLGDGRQASHWKADELTGFLIGAMDPTLASGVATPVMFSDLRPLDLIGYEINPLAAVPEPSTVIAAVLLVGVSAVETLRRRRRVLSSQA